jgi:hypothetical protein
MATKSSRRGVTSLVALGVRELPRNASWLLAKALNPVENGANGGLVASIRDESLGNGVGRSLADTVRSAGATLKDAIPVAGNSVELRLQRAHAATERAREAEDQAVRSAEAARQLVDELKQIDRDEQARLQAVRKEHAQEVQERVAEARRDADAQVEAAREAAERAVEKRMAKESEASARRVAEAREEVDRAKAQAERDLAVATEQLEEARRLADEATAAAEAAADDAHQEAERLSARAQSGARERDDVAAEVDKLQRTTASKTQGARKRASAPRPSGGSRSRTSASSRQHRGPDLTNRTKQELLELARVRDVAGRSEMSKAQLVRALRARNGR